MGEWRRETIERQKREEGKVIEHDNLASGQESTRAVKQKRTQFSEMLYENPSNVEAVADREHNLTQWLMN